MVELTAKIAQLASSHGLVLGHRSVSGYYCYDGKNLGIYYQEWEEWSGQDWNKTQLRIELKEILAEDICHDLAHYCLAPQWARDLPEFGLEVPSWEYFNANGGYHIDQDESRLQGLFSAEEQLAFEEKARLLGIYFCYMAEINTTNDIRHWNPTFWGSGELNHVPNLISEELGIAITQLKIAIDWTNDHPRLDRHVKWLK